MKKNLFLFLAVIISNIVNAQSIIYNNSFKLGTMGYDAPVAIKTTTNGDFIVAGNFEGLTDFDPSPTTVTLTPLGQKDIFIAKYDASGNFMWVKHIGSIGGESVSDMDVDGAGNIVIGGDLGYTLDMNPGAGTNTLALTYANNQEGFVAKYDMNGNYIWAKKVQVMNTSSYNQVDKLDINGNNEIYIGGFFSGTIGFDFSGTVVSTTSAGASDIFFSRMSASGNFLYRNSIGGTGTEIIKDIAANNSNEVIICGEYQSPAMDIDPTASTNTLGLSGTLDGFVAKYNTMGNLQFGFKLGSTAVDRAEACTFDNSGNVIVAGTYMGTVDFDPSVATATITIPPGAATCLSKYTSTGVYSWSKRVSYSSVNTVAASLLIDASNNILLSGSFAGTNDFDPAAAASYTLASSGSMDAFYSNYDAAGLFKWVFNVGGTSADYGVDMSYFNNTYYTTGYYSSQPIDMDPSAATASLSFSNGTDIFAGVYTYSCTPPAAPVSTTPQASLTLCAGKSATLSVTGQGSFAWYSSPTSTNVVATGTSYITPILPAGIYSYYIDANTCTFSNVRTEITVTVNPLPNVAITGNNTFCYGVPAVLIASGASTYTWSNTSTANSLSITPFVNYTVSVTGIDASGCKSTATKSIIVNQLPNVSASTNKAMLCVGQSATLTANGAVSYTWSTSQNGSSISVNPSSTVSYSVIGENASGCTKSATVLQNVSLCTLLNEANNEGSLIIYPNPTNGLFVIETQDETDVVIYNVIGKIIYSNQLKKGKNELGLNDQPAGIYMIQLKQNDHLKVIKLIKQ